MSINDLKQSPQRLEAPNDEHIDWDNTGKPDTVYEHGIDQANGVMESVRSEGGTMNTTNTHWRGLIVCIIVKVVLRCTGQRLDRAAKGGSLPSAWRQCYRAAPRSSLPSPSLPLCAAAIAIAVILVVLVQVLVRVFVLVLVVLHTQTHIHTYTYNIP